MVTQEIVHLVVGPSDNIDTTLVKEAAAILTKEPYETRMLLSGKLPHLIAHYRTAEEAEPAAKQLKTLGLVAFTVLDSELSRFPTTRFTARGVDFVEQKAVFRDNSNHNLTLETKDVFLILKGKYQISADKTVTTTKMKFNLTATLVTGGIPIWNKVKETTKANSDEMGFLIRIYDLGSSDPKVEFFENGFNYSSLGKDIAPSTTANFNSIAAKLRAIFPVAIFDDRLTQPMGTSQPYDRQANAVELNCKLIYLYHRAVNNSV
jgi:hypothetical protein